MGSRANVWELNTLLPAWNCQLGAVSPTISFTITHNQNRFFQIVSFLSFLNINTMPGWYLPRRWWKLSPITFFFFGDTECGLFGWNLRFCRTHAPPNQSQLIRNPTVNLAPHVRYQDNRTTTNQLSRLWFRKHTANTKHAHSFVVWALKETIETE